MLRTNVVFLRKRLVMKSKKYKEHEANDDIVSDTAIAYGQPSGNPQFLLIDKIQQGVSFQAFSNLVRQSPFTLLEWSGFLHITDRTILRYKTDQKPFEGLYAEKIVELTMLIKKGLDTFQTKERFYRWLTASNMALGGYKPIELLVTSVGIEVITQELIRIDYGILA